MGVKTINVQHERLGDVLLPNFLLVGAAKSATTSMHYYLDQHPDIRMPSVKEPWFFSFADNPPSYNSPSRMGDVVYRLDEYVKLFEGARTSQQLGDASPSCLYTYRESIRIIQSIYPPDCKEKLRIIISLRNPVSRAYSQYWTFKRDLQEPLTFEEAVEGRTIKARLKNNWNIFYDYIGFGCYYEQVKAYLEAFGSDRVLILLYEDVQKDPVAACQRIFEFLGVDSSFVPDVQIKYNSLSGEPVVKWFARLIKWRNPVKRALVACLPKNLKRMIQYSLAKLFLKRTKMDESLRLRLVRAYANEINQLETLINRDLSHWKKGI